VNDPRLDNLAIDDLHPHPDNPRLTLREDVVERIATEITRSGFSAQHAITVRPIDAGYQLISGHHRAEAARRAGLDTIPAWVAEMDDDEAFMQLVLSNSQGELTPIEIGMHALRAVPLAQGKDGAGLSAYAERIGRSRPYVSKLRAAAEVMSSLRSPGNEVGLDQAQHLYEISLAPRETWPVLTSALASKGWSVAETADAVTAIKRIEVPDRWAAWLPLVDVIERYLAGRFSPDTYARLIAAADDVLTWLDTNSEDVEAERDVFRKWLGSGPDAIIDRREIGSYKATLIAEKRKRDEERARHEEESARAAYVVPGWHHGRWQQFVDEIGDGSVALLLTDPPYGMEYRSNYRKERHEPIAGDDLSGARHAYEVVTTLLEQGKFAEHAHVLVFCSWREELEVRESLEAAGLTLRGSLVWDKQATGMGDLDRTFAPAHERIVHAVKGDPKLYRRAPDLLSVPRVDTSRHPTEKPTALLAELIEATTAPGQLVADPFGGVASTAAAAKDTDRRWWSCELDEGYWASGEERLS
jgi:ParB/RepB/Spo0J family partition protein